MDQTYIDKIKINKIRHLNDITILISEEERKHLMLTGKNGSGKTSVIEELANYFKDPSDKKFQILTEKRFFGENDAYDNNISSSLNSQTLFLTIKNPERVPSLFFKYFDINRRLLVHKSEGSKDLISNSVVDFEKFLAKKRTEQAFMSFENSNKQKVEEISKWFLQFELNLQYLLEDGSLKLLSRRKEDILEFYLKSDLNHEFDFNTLASGHSSILYILFDIMLAMEDDNSFDYTKEGIVFIDEIDAHLHISLQKKILPFLTSFFPNVQFVITTHSPFILQSIPDAVIFDLATKKRYEDFSIYSSETIVESFYNNDKFSYALKIRMNEYEKLLQNGVDHNDQIIELRKSFFQIQDPEIQFWIKNLDLTYGDKIKSII